jgi:hypothetical protein
MREAWVLCDVAECPTICCDFASSKADCDRMPDHDNGDVEYEIAQRASAITAHSGDARDNAVVIVVTRRIAVIENHLSQP